MRGENVKRLSRKGKNEENKGKELSCWMISSFACIYGKVWRDGNAEMERTDGEIPDV